MRLLNPQEHIYCFNYEKGERPAIEEIEIPEGDKWCIFPIDNKIIFVLSGELVFSFGEFENRVIPQGKVMVLPAGNNFEAMANQNTSILIFRIRAKLELCDAYSIEKLKDEFNESDEFKDIGYLDVDERLTGYLVSVTTYIKDGLRCYYLFLIKLKELFYLLRAYYPKDELYHFFYPIISNDTTFSDLVLKNHHKVKTVHELANLVNYSLSGFQKKFKKVFGVPAYQWMNEQRSKSILHEINTNKKSFKEISFEYGFSSPSHFNDFCKINFGDTPGKIRKKSISATIFPKKV